MLTRTPDPIQPMRRSPNPNQSTKSYLRGRFSREIKSGGAFVGLSPCTYAIAVWVVTSSVNSRNC